MSAESVPESDPIGVFILSAPEDEEYRRRLEQHLGPLCREGAITLWHTGLIAAGDDVRTTMLDRMRAARVFVLLVSPDYGASCWDDQELILSRRRLVGARVVPVLARAFDWQHGPLSNLRPLPFDVRPVAQWPDKDAAWEEVVRGVRQIVDEERRQPATAPLPFRDDAELALAWRAGAETAWAEVGEILKRGSDHRLAAQQKIRRRNMIMGVVGSALCFGMIAWLWVAHEVDPFKLFCFLMIGLIGVVEVIVEQRRNRRLGLGTAIRVKSD